MANSTHDASKGGLVDGKKHTEKARHKISLKGKGRKLSEEHKIKIGLANKGNKRPDVRKIRGELHPNWKGGVTAENHKIRGSIEYRLWRESVFARDNWTCKKCNTKGGRLHPHHIKNFASYIELRFAIDNGITLCINCHKKFHTLYGIKNNDIEQINNFLRK